MEKIYMYEIFQNKYYMKINEIFKDHELIRKLDKMYLSDNKIRQHKLTFADSYKFDIEPELQDVDISNKYEHDDLYERFSKKYCLKRLVCPFAQDRFVKLEKVSNLTNCIDGHFHDFAAKGKKIICSKCNELATGKTGLIEQSEKIFTERYIIVYLRKLATKYCQSGQIHRFEYNNKLDKNICKNCKYIQGSPIIYPDSELYKLYDTIENKLKANNLKANEIISKQKNISQSEIATITNLFNKIVYKYEKYNNDISKSIAILLDSIQKLLGIDIIIDSRTYNLNWNIYIIDHDYNGIKLDKPIMIYEKENKFRLVEKHPQFERDVLVYTMMKNTKYELFYDLEEKVLLGYREINKEYKNVKNHSAKLKINYSIKNMLNMIGFTREKINIKDFYPEIIGMSQAYYKDKFKDFHMDNFVNKIAFRRFEVIKNLGMELKKYIARFKNNYKVDIITIEATFTNNQNQSVTNTYVSDSANSQLDIIYNKYRQKIDRHIITEKTTESKESKESKNNKQTEKTHVFLKHINLINIYLPFENIKFGKNEKIIFSEFIDYDIIKKNDYMGNITLNYIFDEIIRLIEFNTNKNLKTNITHFILDLIVNLFNKTFYEISRFKQELNYFQQILYTSEFYLETQNTDFMIDAIDYYSNQEEIKNIENLSEEDRDKLEDEIENDNEEFVGADMPDEEFDAEGVFDRYSIPNESDEIEPTILV
jgi:hypothetical protein